MSGCTLPHGEVSGGLGVEHLVALDELTRGAELGSKRDERRYFDAMKGRWIGRAIVRALLTPTLDPQEHLESTREAELRNREEDSSIEASCFLRDDIVVLSFDWSMVSL